MKLASLFLLAAAFGSAGVLTTSASCTASGAFDTGSLSCSAASPLLQNNLVASTNVSITGLSYGIDSSNELFFNAALYSDSAQGGTAEAQLGYTLSFTMNGPLRQGSLYAVRGTSGGVGSSSSGHDIVSLYSPDGSLLYTSYCSGATCVAQAPQTAAVTIGGAGVYRFVVTAGETSITTPSGGATTGTLNVSEYLQFREANGATVAAISETPEPAALALCAAGGLAFLVRRASLRHRN